MNKISISYEDGLRVDLQDRTEAAADPQRSH